MVKWEYITIHGILTGHDWDINGILLLWASTVEHHDISTKNRDMNHSLANNGGAP
jgi:hypothetical protein